MSKDGETEPEQDKIDPNHLAWIEFSPDFREKLRGARPPVIPPEELFDTLPPNQAKRAVSNSEARPAVEASDGKIPGLTTTTLKLSRPLDAKLRYVAIGTLIVAIALGAWWAVSSGPSRAPSNAATSSGPANAPSGPTQQIVAPQSSTPVIASSTSTPASTGSAAVPSAAASGRSLTGAHSPRSASTPATSPRTASSNADSTWFRIKE